MPPSICRGLIRAGDILKRQIRRYVFLIIYYILFSVFYIFLTTPVVTVTPTDLVALTKICGPKKASAYVYNLEINVSHLSIAARASAK